LAIAVPPPAASALDTVVAPPPLSWPLVAVADEDALPEPFDLALLLALALPPLFEMPPTEPAVAIADDVALPEPLDDAPLLALASLSGPYSTNSLAPAVAVADDVAFPKPLDDAPLLALASPPF
jgi:hypothetical protein